MDDRTTPNATEEIILAGGFELIKKEAAEVVPTPTLTKLNRKQRRQLEKQQRKNKMSKVINMPNQPQQIQLDPNAAVAQIDNQIAQIEQQILQGKRQYAGAYVNIAIQASLAQYKDATSLEDAITNGFKFAESVRVAASAYEKEVRENAPVDPAIEANKEMLFAQRATLQRMLDDATQKAVAEIQANPELTA